MEEDEKVLRVHSEPRSDTHDDIYLSEDIGLKRLHTVSDIGRTQSATLSLVRSKLESGRRPSDATQMSVGSLGNGGKLPPLQRRQSRSQRPNPSIINRTRKILHSTTNSPTPSSPSRQSPVPLSFSLVSPPPQYSTPTSPLGYHRSASSTNNISNDRRNSLDSESTSHFMVEALSPRCIGSGMAVLGHDSGDITPASVSSLSPSSLSPIEETLDCSDENCPIYNYRRILLVGKTVNEVSFYA